MNLLVKIFVMIGSSASIGFGIWHFFVPRAWNWYSYIDINATELVAAVRAINAFFSLSLVLFGMVNILLIYGDRSNRYSIIVMLAATSILWLTRVAFQVIYPQGSLVSRSPIRNVVSLYDGFSVLRNFAYDDVVPKTSGRRLAICLTVSAFSPDR